MSAPRRSPAGQAVIQLEGATVGAVIAELERRYPGLGNILTKASSAGVDGVIHAEPEYLAISPDTDVYFVAPLTGG